MAALRAIRAVARGGFHVASQRGLATSIEPNLKALMQDVIPAKRQLYEKLKTELGERVIGEVRVKQVVGGMREIPAMVWEGSVVDPNKGVSYHGHTVQDCLKNLPRGTTGKELAAEGLFWLQLTGKVPTESQVRQLSRAIAQQAELPEYVFNMIDGFPKDLHPMTQLSAALSVLNHHSSYSNAYEAGVGLDQTAHWEHMLQDAISLIGKLPTIAAKIYQNSYRGGGPLPAKADLEHDWAYNYAAMLGWGGATNADFQDLLRVHLACLTDHEGGNVSSHTTHLVASALSGPFVAVAAGISGMAGPRHGLAAQEALRYVMRMHEAIGTEYSDKHVEAYLWDTLRSKKLIHGYGHGVLRITDPRFDALLDFGASRPQIAKDSVFKLVQKIYEVAPGVLREFGKSKSVYPNVDAVSGVLYQILGMREERYWCVPLGVARGVGTTAQLVWDRALALPIERPRSMTMQNLLEKAEAVV